MVQDTMLYFNFLVVSMTVLLLAFLIWLVILMVTASDDEWDDLLSDEDDMF